MGDLQYKKRILEYNLGLLVSLFGALTHLISFFNVQFRLI